MAEDAQLGDGLCRLCVLFNYVYPSGRNSTLLRALRTKWRTRNHSCRLSSSVKWIFVCFVWGNRMAETGRVHSWTNHEVFFFFFFSPPGRQYVPGLFWFVRWLSVWCQSYVAQHDPSPLLPTSLPSRWEASSIQPLKHQEKQKAASWSLPWTRALCDGEQWVWGRPHMPRESPVQWTPDMEEMESWWRKKKRTSHSYGLIQY